MSNVRKLALTSILLLILCSTFVLAALYWAEAQTDYSLDLAGYTWDHTTISVNIIPQENEPWWELSYLNATLHGIAQWNDAIQQFSSNYDFDYLSQVSLVPTISNGPSSEFDVNVMWKAMCESEATIGKTVARVISPCIMENSTIYLSAQAPSGHVMNEVDMQNIVVHELGHNFGLSHSNYSGDVMYSTVYYRQTVKPLSTLNLYAVSQIFGWLSNSAQESSTEMCLQEESLALPSSIPYLQLQIAAENLPVYAPQNLAEYAFDLLLRPETLIVVLVGAALIVIGAFIVKRQRKP